MAPISIQKSRLKLVIPLICALFLLFALFNTAVSAAPLILAEKGSYSLAGHLTRFLDKSGVLELKDILANGQQIVFEPVPGHINQGYTTDVVWFSFTLLRKEPFSDEVYLKLWPPYLDFVEVYLQTGADPLNPAAYTLTRLGDHIPVVERPILHQNFVAPFILPENSLRRVYVRVKTSSSLNCYAEIHNNINMISHGNLNIALQSGYLAITLIVSIINMIFFSRLRDRLYLYFSLYLLALFINHLAVTGIINIVWPAMAHQLSDYFVGVGVGLLLIFFALFGMQLFKTRTSPWLHSFFILTITLGSTTFFSIPFGWYNSSAQLLIIWSLLIVFVLTGLSCRRALRGEEGGRLYLIAFGASNIGYCIQFIRVLGLLPVDWWNMYAMQIGTLLNMIFMTIALTDRFNKIEQQALLTARESEQKSIELAQEMTRDIREKQELLENALQREKEAMHRKDIFIAMINHEYRTPLAIIQANISLLELKISDTGSLTSIFSKMKRAMERLVEVLETSKGNEQQSDQTAKERHRPILLGTFLKKLLREAETLWPERQLQADIPPLPGKTISGDRTLLKTAFLNLLSNAYKYSSKEQPVSLEVAEAGNKVTITIADHGCGIHSEDLPHVFEKSFRGQAQANTIGKGVGLYLVKSVIEQSGGAVALTSREGSGTVATVSLPLQISR